jgi:hypothetical protein
MSARLDSNRLMVSVVGVWECRSPRPAKGIWCGSANLDDEVLDDEPNPELRPQL